MSPKDFLLPILIRAVGHGPAYQTSAAGASIIRSLCTAGEGVPDSGLTLAQLQRHGIGKHPFNPRVVEPVHRLKMPPSMPRYSVSTGRSRF